MLPRSIIALDLIKTSKPSSPFMFSTMELTKSTGNNIVFHTSHEIIKTKLIKNFEMGRNSFIELFRIKMNKMIHTVNTVY